MDDRIGNRAMWAIRISAIVAVIVWLLAYLVVSPALDQPLVERIKHAAETELARIPGPPDFVLEATEIASGSDSVSVYARYSGEAQVTVVRDFYDKSLRKAGWRSGDRTGYYNREDFCLRIIQSGQGGFEVELAWRREWCHRSAPVPLFGVATFAAGLGQLGLVLSWPWLQHVRKADPDKLGHQVVNDPTFRLSTFRKSPEIGILSAWFSAISGIVMSLGILVVAVVLATNSWLLIAKWQ